MPTLPACSFEPVDGRQEAKVGMQPIETASIPLPQTAWALLRRNLRGGRGNGSSFRMAAVFAGARAGARCKPGVATTGFPHSLPSGDGVGLRGLTTRPAFAVSAMLIRSGDRVAGRERFGAGVQTTLVGVAGATRAGMGRIKADPVPSVAAAVGGTGLTHAHTRLPPYAYCKTSGGLRPDGLCADTASRSVDEPPARGDCRRPRAGGQHL